MGEIIKSINEWKYINELPTLLLKFEFSLLKKQEDEIYYIFSYKNHDINREIISMYDHSTKEFLLKVRIGLLEYCDTLFISNNIEKYENLLKERLKIVLDQLENFNINNLDSILFEKDLIKHEFSFEFPQEIAGFNLFIKYTQPVKLINGSYIIIDYSDFENDSNLVIYYNIFRDEFFGELRFKKTPEMISIFDSKEVMELEEKIKLNLSSTLKKMRSRIEGNNG